MKRIALLLSMACAIQANAQTDPAIISWIINTTGATGYNSLPSNVQQVQYSTGYVYVSASCIPGYSIGPWNGNPNTPVNENFVYKITRTPLSNTGTPTTIGLGHVGVWTNGVSVFNTQDAMSYNNQGVWNQNAEYFEGSSFDNCLGHPAPNGEYHHHVSPKCLYDITDNTHHSPIIGYAFDGFPIYGAYGYSDTDGTGGIRRMRSGFRLGSITDRTTLPDGTTASSAGPAISAQYALGAYQEDYEFVAGYGDLDVHNGRFCKTPEYPNGIYAYFVTLDSTLNPEYPYTLGLTYYGVVPAGNTGPSGGHNSITEAVQTYDPNATAVAQVTAMQLSTKIYPNPAGDQINLFIQPINANNFMVAIIDASGRTVFTQENVQPTILYSLDVSRIPSGTYSMTITNDKYSYSQKVVIVK